MEAGIPARLTAAAGRKFGGTVGGAFLVMSALLHFWRHKEIAASVTGGLGALLLLLALVVPTQLGPLERAWMGLAHAISKVTTPIFMGVVFFVIMTPVGLVMRLIGRRTLVHKADADSFWKKVSPSDHSSLERQF